MGHRSIQVAATHRLPTPMMVESERVDLAAQARVQLVTQGMTIVRERRVRNPVFDKPGERTTFVFEVKLIIP